MLVALAKIKVDSSLQSRASLDPEQVRNLATVFKAEGADAVAPGEVMDDGEHLWLWDGFHRYHGAAKAELAEMHVNITKGTHRQAVLKSAGANDEHKGKMRSDADKRRAVNMVLDDSEWCEFSGRQIGEICKVSHTFVEDIRTERAYALAQKSGKNGALESDSNARRTAKDGRRVPAKRRGSTFNMCDRCTRMGRPSCTKCKMKADSGKEPLGKGVKPKKPGDALFDWSGFDKAYGVVSRGPDEVAREYTDKGEEFRGLRRLLVEFRKTWDAWRKKCLKAKPGE